MNLLPPLARAKLSTLVRESDDADALARAAFAAIKMAEAKLTARLNALETADEERTTALKGEAEALGNEIDQLRAVMTERQSRRDAAQQLVSQLSGWLDRQGAGVSFELAPPIVRERRDEGPRAAVERLRGEIGALRGELRAVLLAPLPPAELKERARRHVVEAAARGRPRIAIEGGKFSVKYLRQSALVAGDVTTALTPDAAAWLLQDQMIAAFEREVDALGITNGLSDGARAAQSAALRDRILAVERAEEAEIERASAEGLSIPRRVDAHPNAVLGISIVGARQQAA